MELILYDGARRAIMALPTVQEAAEFKDRAEAVRVYAIQCRDRKLELHAIEIRERAEFRIGQLLEEDGRKRGERSEEHPERNQAIREALQEGATPEDVAGQFGLSERRVQAIEETPPVERPPTLEERGIARHDAVHCRKVAALGEETLEAKQAERRQRIEDEPDTPVFGIMRGTKAHEWKRTEPERTPPPGWGNDQYTVIVTDPPWHFPSLPYPTLTNPQIIELGIPAAEHAHLFLWCTLNLQGARQVVEGLGATPKTILTWWKPNVNVGFGGQPPMNAEFIIHGTIGRPPPLEPGLQTCFRAGRGGQRHSAKPDAFYEALRKATPGARRIDIFARGPRAGFAIWGNEIGYQDKDGRPLG